MGLKALLLSLSRRNKRILMALFDTIAIPGAVWTALVIRTGDIAPYIEHLTYTLPILLASTLAIFTYMGMYRAVLRFLGSDFVWIIIKAVTISSLILGVSIYLLKLQGFPRSVPFIYWMLMILFIGGSRFLAQAFLQSNSNTRKKIAAIYGAGVAGHKLSLMLANNPNKRPVCFIDDNPALSGSWVNGLPVHDSKKIKKIFEEYNIDEVLLAIPSASQSRRNQIFQDLEALPVHIYTVPAVEDIVSGRASVADIREIDVEDLLGREPVPANQELLHACITKKCVMITGAGGSIGSELCRQIIRLQPNLVVLYEVSEYALYAIEQDLASICKASGLTVKIIPILGDVKDKKHVDDVINTFGVQTIYHAAAYKHVPIVESNVIEGIKNNIFGTKTLVESAIENNVETFVLISTDKAVRPTNIMGATKRFAELILQDKANKQSATRVCMVRFGNVLGSSGSVVPVFRKQIARGGPVTVTHPDIVRYFMTIPEASELVIQAGSMGKGGDVFVLDMGQPVKINDLARKMIHLSGYEVRDGEHPHGDIEITYTGLRPGEKLYEELLIGENVTGTDHKMIMRANEDSLSEKDLRLYLDELQGAITNNDINTVKSTMSHAISGYVPEKMMVDHLYLNDKKQGDTVVKFK